MQQTRQRIIDVLGQRGSATAQQLAKTFGMTPANLRRHLGILEQRGLIQASGIHQGNGRGRPEITYSLATKAKPENFTTLAGALLSLAPDTQKLAQEIVARSPEGNSKPTGNISRRLVAAVQQLNSMGYQAHWEARPQGPQMVLGNCPYAAIIAEHPQLCSVDAKMLELLLGAPVEQASKLQPGANGMPQCVFQLK